MLNRMVELATQSSNGTYSDEVDRENLQAEVDSLKEEIDRISEGTNFNGINLLDGSLGSSGGVSTGVNVKFDGLDSKPDFLKLNAATKDKATITFGATTNAGTSGEVSLEIKFSDANGSLQSKTVSFTTANNALNDGANKTAIEKALQEAFGDDYVVTGTGTAGEFTIEAKNAGSTEFEVFGVKATKADGTEVTGGNATKVELTTNGTDAYNSIDIQHLATYDGTNEKSAVFEVNGQKFAIAKDQAAADKLGSDVHYVLANANTNAAGVQEDAAKLAALIKSKTGVDAAQNGGAGTVINLKPSTKSGTSGDGLVLQIGDTAEDYNKITVNVGAMDTASLGISGIDIKTATGADAAIKKIKDAINTVSSTRGDLGAIQNRLEHTINNLGVTTENITSAESRIRDTDMASEMMAYTKNNILVQASQAMLAQANTLPQGVLQLLQ